MSDGLKLLAGIINTGSANALIRTDRELFTETEVVVYDFIRGFFRQYREMPEAQTVVQETGTRLPVASENLQFYIDQVQDRHVYGVLRDGYAELRDEMRDRDISRMSPIIERMARASRRPERGAQIVTLHEAYGLVEDRLLATRGLGGITGIETGWPTYDGITGGYQNADLISIIGRPGVAKTYNLLKQAEYAHQSGHSPLVVTTEMGVEQLARRMVAIKLGVNPEALKRNMISTYTQRRIANLRAEMLADSRFHIFSVGMGAKVSSIEALMQEYGPSIVFIDGAYLLHPTIKGKMNRIERVGEVFDELKGLTIDANIPFVVTMQFNRQAGKDGRDGSLENIGFTDAVGMHSSIVVGLKYGPTEDPRASRTMEFLKGREGEVGQVHMNFKFAPLDMSELSPEAAGATAPDGVGADVDWMIGA